MQNARVKALIITNYCGLSSLVVQPDTVRRALYSCVKMDSWLLKRYRCVESDIDTLGATSSTVEYSPAEKKEDEKILNGLPDIRFYLSTRKRGRASPVCWVWWSSRKHSFNGRNLRRHLTTKRESLGNKPLQFFERKQLEIRKQSNLTRTAVTTSTEVHVASFEVSYLIVKNKKPHTIGEPLLLSAAMKMCEIMHGEKYAKLLKQILSLIIQ
jgi:hypothetical protein